MFQRRVRKIRMGKGGVEVDDYDEYVNREVEAIKKEE